LPEADNEKVDGKDRGRAKVLTLIALVKDIVLLDVDNRSVLHSVWKLCGQERGLLVSKDSKSLKKETTVVQ